MATETQSAQAAQRTIQDQLYSVLSHTVGMLEDLLEARRTLVMSAVDLASTALGRASWEISSAAARRSAPADAAADQGDA